jgi:hypothetical protein
VFQSQLKLFSEKKIKLRLFSHFFMLSRHDKTKTSSCVKLNPLPRNDSRCKDLQEDMVVLACNTCNYVSKPIKNETHNISQANYQARQAHKPQNTLVPQGNCQPCAAQQPGNQLGVSETSSPFGTPSVDNLSLGHAPMSIDQSQTTTEHAASVANTLTEQHGFTMNVTEGRARMAPDGSTLVEGNFQLNSKGSTVATQIAEYKHRVTHLQAQCKAIETERVRAVEHAQEERSNKEFFSSIMGSPILEAIADNKSGMELMFSGLANKVLLQAITKLVDPDAFDSFCASLPDIDLDHPFLKRMLIEEKGMDTYLKIRDMTNRSLAQKLPRLDSVGVTPKLLRKMKLLPATIAKPEAKVKPNKRTHEDIYWWGDFKTDYAYGRLPPLRNFWDCGPMELTKREKLVMLLHLHLSRDDGERPELFKITSDDWVEERFLAEYDFKNTKLYVAYECIWLHPNGVTKVNCRVAQNLVRKCPKYTAKIKAFEDMQLCSGIV